MNKFVNEWYTAVFIDLLPQVKSAVLVNDSVVTNLYSSSLTQFYVEKKSVNRQAGAELCQAQEKLGWLARLLSLTVKLFLPLELFKNKIKEIEINFYFQNFRLCSIEKILGPLCFEKYAGHLPVEKITGCLHLENKIRSSSIWREKKGRLQFEKIEIVFHMKKKWYCF